MVKDCGEAAGVDMSLTAEIPNMEIGTFFVIPDERRVHYQRSHSAWKFQGKDIFNWKDVLNRKGAWLHVTGISPLTGENPRVNIFSLR